MDESLARGARPRPGVRCLGMPPSDRADAGPARHSTRLPAVPGVDDGSSRPGQNRANVVRGRVQCSRAAG